jgi:hypothetical protein
VQRDFGFDDGDDSAGFLATDEALAKGALIHPEEPACDAAQVL